jgi:hypothetical protein
MLFLSGWKAAADLWGSGDEGWEMPFLGALEYHLNLESLSAYFSF